MKVMKCVASKILGVVLSLSMVAGGLFSVGTVVANCDELVESFETPPAKEAFDDGGGVKEIDGGGLLIDGGGGKEIGGGGLLIDDGGGKEIGGGGKGESTPPEYDLNCADDLYKYDYVDETEYPVANPVVFTISETGEDGICVISFGNYGHDGYISFDEFTISGNIDTINGECNSYINECDGGSFLVFYSGNLDLSDPGNFTIPRGSSISCEYSFQSIITGTGAKGETLSTNKASLILNYLGFYSKSTNGNSTSTGEDASSDHHVHCWEYGIITEPTETTKGLEGEYCSCGAVRNTAIIPCESYLISELYKKIDAAQPGLPTVLDLGNMNSLSRFFMNKLATKNDCDFIIKFTFDGANFEVSIPAGTVIDTTLDWNGPATLCKFYDFKIVE